MVNWVGLNPPSGEVVFCDPVKVARNWRFNPKSFPPGGGDMGKIAYLSKHLPAGGECDVPEGGFADRDSLRLGSLAPPLVLTLDGGRHRIRWCLDNGEPAIPIRFWGSGITNAKSLLV